MIIIVFFLSAMFELIDSSLGMMYGTLLSPTLILMGYEPKYVVPSILVAQAAGGLIASAIHQKYGNGNFSGLTRDTKVVLSIVVPGLISVLLGSMVAVKIPSQFLSIYIGLLVIVMGLLCIRPIYYNFSWWRIWIVGLLSSFNKVVSGGGFGPVTSTGKILGGLDSKTSISTTTLSEVPICLSGYIAWIILNGSIGAQLPITLMLGAILGGLIGPYITHRFNTKTLKVVVGILAVLCGLGLLILKVKI